MVTLTDHKVYLYPDGTLCAQPELSEADARANGMAWRILAAHNQSGNMEQLRLKFDALVSPDNNYVSILQTARASGMEKFPVPYVLSNCHNTLCGVGGTINEDDHTFGLDNARRYGGIFVPRYRAVLHQYMREMMAGCGKMILGSDSHTRYGAVGTMGIGEGGGEIAKQLLGRTYDLNRPPVIAVVLRGAPRPGVGPMDVALAMIAKTFKNGFNKNKILEVLGPGVASLSMEYRMGIDVMTTESAALSSIWVTDEKTRTWLEKHGRPEEYRPLAPAGVTCYDGLIEIDLDKVECMMALPYHPSNSLPIREFKADPAKYLAEVEAEGNKIKGGRGKPFHIMDKLRPDGLHVDQALVSGCAGGMFENLSAMADILKGCALPGDGPFLGINPASQPVYLDAMRKGIGDTLIVAGAVIRGSMCGPCFGVSDIPADNQLSIRHVTRNYPNREGSKPGGGQMAAAILMDARSIAATVRNGGVLTAATELDVEYVQREHDFDPAIYQNQVYDNAGKPDASVELRMGPNIASWPEMHPYAKHLLLRVAGAYDGSVTTDELVPSGDATAYRSNPEKISEYTMISKDPGYRARAKAVRSDAALVRAGKLPEDPAAACAVSKAVALLGCKPEDITYGSLMTSDAIGDGSSREQAASNQKVLGGCANLACEYSTKRYRSNLINWGILPLLTREDPHLQVGDFVLIENVREAIAADDAPLTLRIWNDAGERTHTAALGGMTKEEKEILASGCLINYYKNV